MNDKKAKQLRKQAQAMTVGNPTRLLVQGRQELNAENQKKANARYVIGAVNAPGTTRGVYRALKSGRTIDPKIIVMQQDPPKRSEVAQATASISRANAPQRSFLQRMRDQFNRWLHRQ